MADQDAPRQYPLPTWRDGTEPSVDQLRDWLHAHTREQDARIAADMILGMLAEEKQRVRVMRALLTHVTRRADRNRVAWLSARRRATRVHLAYESWRSRLMGV